jgi:hypothetical protein
MGVTNIGGTTGAAQDVDSVTKAARVTLRPIDVGALGSYSHALKSGVEAAGASANSPIWNFRWAPATVPTSLALIRRIKFSAWNLGTGFTAGNFVFDFFIARSFSVDDTGGTAATLTTNNAKLRTSMATTQATIRGGTTGVLTAGTRTKDAMPFRTIAGVVANAAFSALVPDVEVFRQQPGEQPITLATGEGLVLEATVPATGTWTWALAIEWDEVTAAQFAGS